MPGTFAYTKSTNMVVVTGGTSGSPADFASMLTADRAGTVTLLAAWSPNNNTKALTYQITPAELRALLISFVVASKTAQTDYIFITGTDAWDAAQTESINVSAGNGTYTSTKRFRTITSIDCSDNAAGGGTLWADGTVLVRQPQWGVVWDYSAVAAYRQDCKLEIGDGSTATYFGSTDEIILIGPGVCTADYQSPVTVKANAYFVSGTLIDETKKLVSNPSVISNLVSQYDIRSIDASPDSCVVYLYGTVLLADKTNFSTTYIKGASRLWHTLHSYDAPVGLSPDTNVYGMRCFAGSYAIHSTECDIMANLVSLGDNTGWCPALVLYSTAVCTISDVSLYGHSHVFNIAGLSETGVFNLVDVVNYPKASAVGEFQDLWLGDGSEGFEYATGGHYHLGVVGNMSAEIAWNATAATVQTALEGIFGVGKVTVTDYDYPGYPDAWSLGIEFDPLVGDSNLVADTTALTGGGWYDIELLIAYAPANPWAVYFDTGADETVNRYNTFNVNVCDRDGVFISGAAVDAEDVNGDPCWTAGTVTTDANGDIAQQSILYEEYTAGVDVFIPTIARYSPHKITISKAGYETLIMDNIDMSEPRKWHVELQPYEGQAQSRIVSIGVM